MKRKSSKELETDPIPPPPSSPLEPSTLNQDQDKSLDNLISSCFQDSDLDYFRLFDPQFTLNPVKVNNTEKTKNSSIKSSKETSPVSKRLKKSELSNSCVVQSEVLKECQPSSSITTSSSSIENSSVLAPDQHNQDKPSFGNESTEITTFHFFDGSFPSLSELESQDLKTLELYRSTPTSGSSSEPREAFATFQQDLYSKPDGSISSGKEDISTGVLVHGLKEITHSDIEHLGSISKELENIEVNLHSSITSINEGYILDGFDTLAEVTDLVVNNCEHLGLTSQTNKLLVDPNNFWKKLNYCWMYSLSKLPLSISPIYSLNQDNLLHLRSLVKDWGCLLTNCLSEESQLGLQTKDIIISIDYAIFVLNCPELSNPDTFSPSNFFNRDLNFGPPLYPVQLSLDTTEVTNLNQSLSGLDFQADCLKPISKSADLLQSFLTYYSEVLAPSTNNPPEASEPLLSPDHLTSTGVEPPPLPPPSSSPAPSVTGSSTTSAELTTVSPTDP